MRLKRTEFDCPGVTVTKRWKTPDGKRRQRTRRFWQSVNPWNLNDEGLPKTREEILRECHARADAWLAETEE